MKKTKTIQIRVSEEDFHAIKTRAENLDMTLSEYIRAAGMREVLCMVFDPEIHNRIRCVHEETRRISESFYRTAVSPGCHFDNDVCKKISAQLEKVSMGLQDISILIRALGKEVLRNGDNKTASD